MLKVRLMGSTKDIKWFRKVLRRDSRFTVIQESELFPLGNTTRFFRAYSQIERMDDSNGIRKKKRKTQA